MKADRDELGAQGRAIRLFARVRHLPPQGEMHHAYEHATYVRNDGGLGHILQLGLTMSQ